MTDPKENQSPMFKNLLAYLPVITIALGLIVGGTTLRLQAENTKIKTEELSRDVEKLKETSKDLEKAAEVTKIQQTNTDKKVDEVNQKTDKILDLLIKMQSNK